MKTLDEMTQEEIDRINAEIDAMSHEAMARRWRFAPSGDVMFRSDLPFYERFKARYDSLGGMTQAISKKIG